MRPLLLLAALAFAGGAVAAKRDLDLERLAGTLDKLQPDAALAPAEMAAARAAVEELGKARGKDERAHGHSRGRKSAHSGSVAALRQSRPRIREGIATA